MDWMTVSVIHPTTHAEHIIDVPTDMTVGEMLDEIFMLFYPDSPETRYCFKAILKKNDTALDESKTLSGNNVKEGDCILTLIVPIGCG